MFGLTVTGLSKAGDGNGVMVSGSALRMRARIGRIRTTTATLTAGMFMKAIGRTKTMATTIGNITTSPRLLILQERSGSLPDLLFCHQSIRFGTKAALSAIKKFIRDLPCAD